MEKRRSQNLHPIFKIGSETWWASMLLIESIFKEGSNPWFCPSFMDNSNEYILIMTMFTMWTFSFFQRFSVMTQFSPHFFVFISKYWGKINKSLQYTWSSLFYQGFSFFHFFIFPSSCGYHMYAKYLKLLV